MSSTRTRLRLASAIARACWTALLLAGPGSAFAQDVDLNLWGTDGPVHAVVASGNTLYIGGEFTYVGPYTGGGVPVAVGSGAAVAGFPKVRGTVTTVVPDGQGGWFIGGDFDSVGSAARNNLAQVRSDLGVSAWDPGTDGPVRALVLNLGVVYAGGDFTMAGGQARNRVAGLDATTGQATAWNPDPNGAVHAIAVNGSTVYLGGAFTQISLMGRNRLGAVDAATGLVTLWNPSADDVVRGLAIAPTTVYASGDFANVGGQPRGHLAALDMVNGTPMLWAPNADGPVRAIALSGTTVYAGGSFTTVGLMARSNVAGIDATTGLATTWNPGANGPVQALVVSGSTVYLGGDFSSAGGAARRRLAAVDAGSGAPTSWDPKTNAPVLALSVGGSTVFAGGEFTSLGGVNRNRIAALDVDTGQATSWDPNADGTVRTLSLGSGVVYAGGDFTTAGGQTRNRAAALNSSTGAPTAWNPNADGTVRVLVASGSAVFAGGDFTSIGSAARDRIAELDATGTATGWNPGADGSVNALAVRSETVYAGGAFTHVGGETRNYLARIDRTTGVATAWNPGADAPVDCMFGSDCGVYVGGRFTQVGGLPRGRLAFIDGTGQLNSWNPDADQAVLAMSYGSLIGGDFTTVGGQSHQYLAAIQGNEVEPWWPTPNARVRALSSLSFPSGFGSVRVDFAGGDFTEVGGMPATYLAAIATEQSPVHVPDPAKSSIGCNIRLGGITDGVADPNAEKVIVIRDASNTPIAFADVAIRFANCTQAFPGSLQPDPIVTLAECDPAFIRVVTDAAGTARFSLAGSVLHRAGAGGTTACAEVIQLTNGTCGGISLGSLKVAAYDQDGVNGLTANDLSLFACDRFGAYQARSDYDCTGTITTADLALWAEAWAEGGSKETAARCDAGPTTTPLTVVQDGDLRLAWNYCRSDPGARDTASFACNTNSGENLLVASIVAPDGVENLTGFEAEFEVIGNEGVPLVDWWRLDPSGCRQNALSVDMDLSQGGSCASSWPGANTLVAQRAEYPVDGDLHRERIRVLGAVTPPGNGLVAGQEYALFTLGIRHTKSTGSGACSGCGAPAAISLRSVRLTQPAVAAGDCSAPAGTFGASAVTSATGDYLINASPNSSASVAFLNGVPAGYVTGVPSAPPGAYRLDRPFPNPVRGAADIRFALPHAGDVSLGIYDIAGRRLRELWRGERAAGEHVVRWDGRDDSGRLLASGLYIVRLRSAAGDAVRTLVVTR